MINIFNETGQCFTINGLVNFLNFSRINCIIYEDPLKLTFKINKGVYTDLKYIKLEEKIPLGIQIEIKYFKWYERSNISGVLIYHLEDNLWDKILKKLKFKKDIVYI